MIPISYCLADVVAIFSAMDRLNTKNDRSTFTTEDSMPDPI